MTSSNETSPRYFSYPELVVFERALQGVPKLRGWSVLLPSKHSDYPKVAYEFRGFGVPPADVGRIGDIFWDVVRPYILYVRGLEGWTPWNPQASDGKQRLAEHPTYSDRYLWLSRSGLAWLTEMTLKLRKRPMDITKSYGLDQNVLAEMDSMLDAAPRIVVNQARYDQEPPHAGSLKRRWDETDDKPTSARPAGTSNRGSNSSSSNISSIRTLPSSISQTIEKLEAEWTSALQREQEAQVAAEAKVEYLEKQVETINKKNDELGGLLQQAGKRCQELTECLGKAEANVRIANEKTRQAEVKLRVFNQNIKQVVDLPAFRELVRG
ncbi:hypothetical protein B0H16DRAFT_1889085 [Mycena metata]|uniref:Uncharacterized protein n=1 Tax=Mycena metata TaxID=1033252 RepID=A0AAD7IML5_9AGAR|nr:hypothetical protein B0H16DRAFT_1889085 [Mycena metata]